VGVRSSLPPHIYAVSDAAFQNMLRNALSQCCVVSGESGAGLYYGHFTVNKMQFTYLLRFTGRIDEKDKGPKSYNVKLMHCC